MAIDQTTTAILRSINGRAQKYQLFGLSRHEYKKFGISEYKMRMIINSLLKKGYIKLVVCENYIQCGPKHRNLFIATEKLFAIVSTLTSYVEDMNNKIVAWCKVNPVQKLRDNGINVSRSGRVGSNDSKITINKKTGAMTNWKTKETMNIFNYLRDNLGETTMYFFRHFIGT